MRHSRKRAWLVLIVTLFLAGLMTSCQSAPSTPAPCPSCPTARPIPTQIPQVCSTAVACPKPGAAAPFEALWAASAHAGVSGVAFSRWNVELSGEAAVVCARCHTSAAFQEFSASGKVNGSYKSSSVITCEACHNQATLAFSEVKFPSGAVVKGLGREAVCLACHQGAAAGIQVDEAIQKAQVGEDDRPNKTLEFSDVHASTAGAASYGKQVGGGYEYAGKAYDAHFEHAGGQAACQDCHNPHSLQLEVSACKKCHPGVTKAADFRLVRMQSSHVDYDGDGNLKEGVAAEIEGLRAILYASIQAYAKEVAGTAIVYGAEVEPYWFADSNGDSKSDPAELQPGNKYPAFTVRLLRAVYNYHFSMKDPGGYAHGGKYIIELLYDSIDSLNAKLSKKVDLAKLHREDSAHFDGADAAFRSWDDTGLVPAACARCHGDESLPTYIRDGVNTAVAAPSGMQCTNCHNDLVQYTRYTLKPVIFPNGAALSYGDKNLDANLCLACHQGRESTVSIAQGLKTDVDKPDKALKYRSVHPGQAGATVFGTLAKGMVEYDGKTYTGMFNHAPGAATCDQCHDAHTQQVKTATCKSCHASEDPRVIRMATRGDFDGNGKEEGLYAEIEGLKQQLLFTITLYARDVVKKPIVFDPAMSPYWFVDDNGDGKHEDSERTAYESFTPRLLKAAYNLHYAVQEPGGATHNGKYVIQVLLDTILDIGGKVNVAPRGPRP